MAERIGLAHRVAITEMNGEDDHVHFLLRAKPNCDLAKYIKAMKSATSRLLKQEFPGIRTRLWQEQLWSQRYCLLTVGGAPLEVLKQYIERQGVKDVAA